MKKVRKCRFLKTLSEIDLILNCGWDIKAMLPVEIFMKKFFAFFLIFPCLVTESLRLFAYNSHHGEGMDGKMLRKMARNTFPSEKPSTEIEFFFAKGLAGFSFEDKIIPEFVASDHRPIAVVISREEKKEN
ncbi:MAG: hypothetical protein ACJAVK_002852 [Akkermansiaceae bacterium]|jgi:hypothetical protein